MSVLRFAAVLAPRVTNQLCNQQGGCVMSSLIEDSKRDDPLDVLQQRFGLDRFKAGQLQVIEALLADRSAAAVFPTGGGKSLCYQLPALLLPGVTLVVSPLIALMKDQCDALASRGIPAGRLDSSLDAAGVAATMRSIRAGEMKILYVAPERFFNERFRAVVEELPIALFAIDEAHCISQWGHNFRPDYLKLAELTRQLRVPRVLALTATATPGVLADIRNAFSIAQRDTVQTPFFRPNLQILSQVVAETRRDQMLLQRIQDRPAGPTLVYVTLQKTTESVAQYLTENGCQARAYHAGLSADDRDEIQNWFLHSDRGVVVATIAFGMGIDKANIRYVYHYNPAKSIEAYAQEIGRAGRDGQDAICESFVVASDRVVLDNFSYGDTPEREGIARLVEIIRGQSQHFHISHYRLSAETDIRILVLRTLLTYLELDGFLRGTAPRYDTYQFRPLVTSKTILAHFEGERRQFISDLLSSAVKGRTWFSIPLAVAARRMNEPRQRLVKAIDYLGQRGWIEVRVSDLVHGYSKEKEIEDPDALVDSLLQRMADREHNELQRGDQIFALLRAPSCQAALLSAHFGQTMEQACGRCTACRGEGPLEMPAPAGGRVGRSALMAMEQLVRQHPQLLESPRARARFLCGLSSPAMTRAKLTRHAMYGVCACVPFADVLDQMVIATSDA
jgi:ATP-dependent DNA helicase RecQ